MKAPTDSSKSKAGMRLKTIQARLLEGVVGRYFA